MNAGLPEYFSFPPSSQGAGRSIELAPGPCAHIPVTTVARQVGTDAAWSKVIFSGICNTSGQCLSQRHESTARTFAAFSAGTMQYCWKVALSGSLTPKEKRLYTVKSIHQSHWSRPQTMGWNTALCLHSITLCKVLDL